MDAQPRVVMVVDDDEAVLGFVKTALESEGYSVITAMNGRLALQALRGQAVNLVITDLMMPKMDGRELARRLRRNTRVPVLLMSGNRETAATPQSLAGVDGFLPKPFSLGDLLSAVSALLADRPVPNPTPS